MRHLVLVALLALIGCAGVGASGAYRVSRVVDGDTVYLTNGAKIRLVEIDTPEVYFGGECYGEAASAATRKLLPPGTLVRLVAEPATDRIDAYGRLLRYVMRARDGVNVNLVLVARGDAAPYFYDGRRGRFATALVRDAMHVRTGRLGLWGACPRTPVEFDRGVDTGSAKARRAAGQSP